MVCHNHLQDGTLSSLLIIIKNLKMTRHIKYSPDDRMISLISDNYSLIQVLSRFGIPMGFADKTVKEICNEYNVDCLTFLTVVNFILENSEENINISDLSLSSLLHYLKQSHKYFIEYFLPAIRRKLLDGIRLNDYDVSFLIIKLFDEYVNEVSSHMHDEENSLFPYVKSLSEGYITDVYDESTYSRHHDEVGSKLKELKNIIIKYCPAEARINLLNDALYDIYRCEDELASHCRIEDCLLIPAMLNMKKKYLNV